MDPRMRRRRLGDRSLTIRMVTLVVAVPCAVLACVAALVALLPAHSLVWLGAVCLVGAAITVWRRGHRERMPGRVLTDGDAPELVASVERLCAVIGMPRPVLVLSEQRQANSWVVHAPRRAPRLYVTTALLELLDPGELQAVLAHELTHIANRDALVMTIVGAPGTVMLAARGTGGLYTLALVAIGLVSEIGMSMLSRCRELAADAGSATITGRPSALASALLRVSDSLQGVPEKDLRAAAALNAFNLVAVAPRGRIRAVAPIARVLRTHPDVEERVARLHELERRRQA